MRHLTQILCALLIALPYGLRPVCARAAQPTLRAGARACCAAACCCNSRPGLSGCQTLPGRDGSEADVVQVLRTDGVRLSISFEPLIGPQGALDSPLADAAPARQSGSNPRGLQPERPLELLCTLQV